MEGEHGKVKKIEMTKDWFTERKWRFNVGLKSIQEYFSHPMLNAKLSDEEQQKVEQILDRFVKKFTS